MLLLELLLELLLHAPATSAIVSASAPAPASCQFFVIELPLQSSRSTDVGPQRLEARKPTWHCGGPSMNGR
jgi:hypothetical protein